MSSQVLSPCRALVRPRPSLLGLLLALAFAGAGNAQGELEGLGLEARSRPVSGSLQPPLPGMGDFSVQLIVDDGSTESVFGFGGANARQFLWMNQFNSPGPFRLEEIWVLFPAGSDIPAGGDIQLVVYLDPDGDPTNGAALLYASDETIQANDGATFSVYPVSPPLELFDPGDILIGVINRYFETGVDPPPTFPAALDTTLSQDRSWVALWAGDPTDPPLLPPDLVTAPLDGASAGNLMIRGFGTRATIVEVPTLDATGLIVLVALIGAFAIGLLRRRLARVKVRHDL